MKKSKAIVARPEVLPATPKPDARAEIERFIEQKLAEMAAGSQNAIFEPWFRSKAVANAIRKNLTIPQRQKWSRYFAEWGCLICGTKERAHEGIGMCLSCHMRTHHRLQAIIKEAEAEQKPQSVPTDLADKARAAIRGKR